MEYLKNLVVRGSMNRCSLYATRRLPDRGLFQGSAYMVVVYTWDISSLQEKSPEMLSKILTELLESAYSGVVDYSTTRRVVFGRAAVRERALAGGRRVEGGHFRRPVADADDSGRLLRPLTVGSCEIRVRREC